jgi:hypothetical protein
VLRWVVVEWMLELGFPVGSVVGVVQDVWVRLEDEWLLNDLANAHPPQATPNPLFCD